VLLAETNLIDDFTAVTFSVKIVCVKTPFFVADLHYTQCKTRSSADADKPARHI